MATWDVEIIFEPTGTYMNFESWAKMVYLTTIPYNNIIIIINNTTTNK
jgi:hypothetical protein